MVAILVEKERSVSLWMAVRPVEETDPEPHLPRATPLKGSS